MQHKAHACVYRPSDQLLGWEIHGFATQNICLMIVRAGLVISYWGGKYMALRRAQKPSALGDEVTGAINLLVRLLPLVQMILMYHLYCHE